MTGTFVHRNPTIANPTSDGPTSDRPTSDRSTDWSRFSISQLWNMVSAEDGVVTYTQVDAWRRMAELCEEQADQLDKAISQLLQRWPARPGSAAEAFAEQVTALVTSMRDAAKAAAANQDPLRNITYALVGARVEIGALLESHRRYALIEQQLTPQPTPSPGQTPLPAAPAGLRPPPPDWRTDLEQQARSIMAHADATVGTEAARLQSPTPYTVGGIFSERSRPLGAEGGGQSETSGSPFYIFDSTNAFTEPGSSALPSGIGRPRDDPEPVLSGGPISNRPTLPDTIGADGARGILPSSQTPPLLDIAALRTGVITPEAPNARAPMFGQDSGRIVSGRSEGSGARASTGAASRAATSGATPMAPMVPPRGDRAAPPGVPSAGRLGRSRTRSRQSQADPGDPWSVAEGGPAILQPAPELADHDPGPGVIGLDQ